MYRDFLESGYGQALQYRKRKRRQHETWWEGSLQTKTSRKPAGDQSFQNAVLKTMERLEQRGPYKGPVFVEFQFFPAPKTPPSIQNLTKHYLDLLMAPVAGLSLKRPKLLLQDDSQVLFLSCTYAPEMLGEGLRLRIRRLSDFFADLRLYQSIQSGDLGRRFDKNDDEFDLLDDSHLDDWNDLQGNKARWKKQLGQKAYDSFELMTKRFAQEEVLKQRKIPLKAMSSLFGAKHHALRNDRLMREILSVNSAMSRYAYFHDLIAVDFGSRPLKEGDTEAFKKRVRDGLESYKKRIPLFSPLLTTVGVTIIYVPPTSGTKVDLDNLARKAIIPAVHEILQPPITSVAFWRSLKEIQPDNPDIALSIDRYKSMPPVHIVGYDILCVDRLDDDPPNGSVKLLLHAGEAMQSTLTRLQNVLDKWESEVERD
jgi:Holliday junction resolvase RusA-like endonuclease